MSPPDTPDVRIEVFPGEAVVAVFERFDDGQAGLTVWVGHVEGEPESHVTLVYGRGLLTGTTAGRRGQHEIRPESEGAVTPRAPGGARAHVIRPVDPMALPREAEPLEAPLTAGDLADAPPAARSGTIAVIDVMVLDAAGVSPNYTMAHEWGHNMGGQHDWFVSSATLPFTYAHGYVNANAGHRWRTIMAYHDHCASLGFRCRRLLAWANASAFVNPLCDGRVFTRETRLWYLPGEQMGVPPGTRSTCRPGNVADTRCDADDRLALNNTGATVAAFSPTMVAGGATGARRVR